jgi:uncharacterized protein YggE
MYTVVRIAIGVAALTAVTALAAPLALAQTTAIQGIGQPAGISVTGDGVVTATPNVALVTVGVDVTDSTLSGAQTQAAQKMDAVVQKLKADGIPDTNIKTVSYNVNPQYDQNQALRGYEVQNLVQVKTTDVSSLGQLMDDVVNAGATRIYGIDFQADNMTDLMAQARTQAMQNAQDKAQQLAQASGVGLGRPTLIEDTQPTQVTPKQAIPAAAPAALAAVPTTPVQPGELQVQSTVHVIYAIQ